MAKPFLEEGSKLVTPEKSGEVDINVATKIDDRSGLFIAHLVREQTYHADGICRNDYLRHKAAKFRRERRC
ncbi:MAG: hypothetical protein ACRD2L_04525 [Terriglobia bacterium]